MEIKTKIGLRIKELRESKGLTQMDLAIEAELDRSYIASIENGKRNVSIVNIERLAFALNISLEKFFSESIFNS
jgi:transcriptional regulator with XRE-family HTH domain